MPVPGDSRVAVGKGEVQGYTEPYRQGRGESTPMKRDNQAPETQPEPQVESLVIQGRGPEEKQVFGTPSSNKDESGEWMEPPRPRHQRKRDRDRGYETRTARSAATKPISGGTLGPKGTQGQGPTWTGGGVLLPTKEGREAQAPARRGSAWGLGQQLEASKRLAAPWSKLCLAGR